MKQRRRKRLNLVNSSVESDILDDLDRTGAIHQRHVKPGSRIQPVCHPGQVLRRRCVNARDLVRAHPFRCTSEIAGTFHFDKDVLNAPLPHGSTEIAKATDRIVEDYLDTLDPNKVASQVRRLLIQLLPSGNVNQDVVANQLNRSKSTLQRQLKTEGLSYRDVLEDTQRSLAENYLNERKHAHAQIAYLLGFSDQSNFSRAFKRWTSLSPKQYQESVGRSR